MLVELFAVVRVWFDRQPGVGDHGAPTVVIAFSDFTTGQVYAVNPDGTGMTQLTHTNANYAAYDL